MLEGLDLLALVARRLARRLGHRVPLEDLIAIGRPALVQITRDYDPARSSFSPYARARLKWAIIDGIRRETRWRSELGRANALAASERYAEDEGDDTDPTDDPVAQRQRLAAVLSAHATAMAIGLLSARCHGGHVFSQGAQSPEEHASQSELMEAVRAAVRALPARERALVERHYFEGERFDHIAEDLGISKSRASRLHARAIEELSRVLGGVFATPAPP
ncbi:MAG: sigma-70 family RNA polymerase sigma factor [Polyangiaceae bacterium]|nr:sigma-70 family RNA polymerase sigma factor [Polyangiaceae bacterium]